MLATCRCKEEAEQVSTHPPEEHDARRPQGKYDGKVLAGEAPAVVVELPVAALQQAKPSEASAWKESAIPAHAAPRATPWLGRPKAVLYACMQWDDCLDGHTNLPLACVPKSPRPIHCLSVKGAGICKIHPHADAYDASSMVRMHGWIHLGVALQYACKPSAWRHVRSSTCAMVTAAAGPNENGIGFCSSSSSSSCTLLAHATASIGTYLQSLRYRSKKGRRVPEASLAYAVGYSKDLLPIYYCSSTAAQRATPSLSQPIHSPTQPSAPLAQPAPASAS